MKKLLYGFANLGIRDKLLLLFFLLISLPVMIIAIRSYEISSKIIKDKTNQYSHDVLYQTTKMVESRLEKIEDVSFSIAFNQEFQQMLLNASNGDLDPYEANQIRTQIEAILSSQVLYHNEIHAIYIVSNGGYEFELNKTKLKYSQLSEKKSAIESQKGGPIWFGGSLGNQDLVLARLINSTLTQKPVGYLVMYIDEGFISELLANTRSVDVGEVVIADAEGSITSAADKELLGTLTDGMNLGNATEDYSFSEQIINGISQYVAMSEPMRNGWRIISTVPVSAYQHEINNLRNSIVLFAVLLLLISVICAWGVSLSISKPIRRLSKTMVHFGEGDFSARSRVGTKDEIGKLATTFNQMADNINGLVQKVYIEQQMKREAELKSLQMQINPHFLYNTLETINWMARIHGTDDIGIIAKSLGDLMRATINSKDYVLIKDEMNSLRNYLQIQKYRYGDKFEAFIEMDPDTEKLYIPKLLIQPLVENAIYHGIEPSFDSGEIKITSAMVQGDLIVTVEDNGVGMASESIEKILDLQNPAGQSSESIGLQNVIKRVKTLFGNDYGLKIESELSEGTKITVRLPALSKLP